MSFPYKHILLVGATSGIGAALADRFIQEGIKVIAVGRRQDRLDAFIQKHGAGKASGIQYDVNDTAGLETFVNKVTTEHPALDCVFLNSGIQSQIRLSRPAEVNLTAFHEEMNTNFNRLVDISMKFLPHLLAKGYPTAIVFTGSLLSQVPAVTMPTYSASKAALTAYVHCLRRQLAESNVKIVEVWPPVVRTELHDYMGADRRRAMGMPVSEFVEKTWPQLQSGQDHVIVGAIGPEEAYLGVVKQRREQFEFLSGMLLGHFEL
ncbi:hypothetical protein BKA63DRAFT_495071 [Paraphoma chrysanthemicola]|nr:hypothetical protein BKA63DRAFT_495071 [Paraphoma chrysanthemicola]